MAEKGLKIKGAAMRAASLAVALQGWLEAPLSDLPRALRERVEREFFPVPWDGLSAHARRALAQQADAKNDPGAQQDAQFWWSFGVRKYALLREIARWQEVAAPTAGDLALKQSRLEALKKEAGRMALQERVAASKAGARLVSPAVEGAAAAAAPPGPAAAQYIACPRALGLLANRLGATMGELAMWVWSGPEQGGLAAYLNANELEPPPRFHFGFETEDFDYAARLMACWFRLDAVEAFEPAERYLTGEELTQRWSQLEGVQPEAFIRAKIAESRLVDAHPVCGTTQASEPQDQALPPLARGLFLLAHVERVEAEDFAGMPGCPSGPALGSREWRSQKARAAANTSHDKPGGSRHKRRLIQEAWASGKYSSRGVCAEEECAAIGMSYKTARDALRNTPEPARC